MSCNYPMAFVNNATVNQHDTLINNILLKIIKLSNILCSMTDKLVDVFA